MKKSKNSYKVIVVFLLLIMFTTSVLPINNLTFAQAKGKIEISDRSLILNIGDTEILTVEGTKKKAIWTSSDAEIVSVNNKGIVIAKNEGKAEITAVIQNKKYTCKVVVLKPENPYIATAPFPAKGLDVGNISIILPKEWKCDKSITDDKLTTLLIAPPNVDTDTKCTNIALIAYKTGEDVPDYSSLKDDFTKKFTTDSLKEIVEKRKEEGEIITVTDLVTSDYITRLGTAFKIDCTITFQKGTEITKLKVTLYILYIDQYVITVEADDIGDNVTPDLKTTTEYMINSIQVNN